MTAAGRMQGSHRAVRRPAASARLRGAPPGGPGGQRGFTLAEMMIAAFLGLFLMAGVIHLFVSSGQGYRVNEGLGRTQESGRFAMDILSRDLRQAGYGARCAFQPPVTLAEDAVGGESDCFDIDSPVMGWDDKDDAGAWYPGGGDPTLSGALDPADGLDRDLIRVKYVAEDSATGVVQTRVHNVLYYIGAGVDGTPALWTEVLGGTAEPLVEHVDALSVTALDSLGSPTTDWEAAVAVRVALRVTGSSTEEPGSKPFDTTIAIRNRLP